MNLKGILINELIALYARKFYFLAFPPCGIYKFFGQKLETNSEQFFLTKYF